MPVTRNNARLANAKGKRQEVKKIKDEEIDDSMLLDETSVKVEPEVKAEIDMKSESEPKTESEYDQSEYEEPKFRVSPLKRPRIIIKPTKGPTGGRRVRGKQGGLAGLVNMPIDIFTEIATYLLPIDIISLSRSNKLFRGLLMSRLSSHIWHGAMKNVRGLPPCPDDLSEPHFLALLFSKHCTMCGQAVRCRMDEILLVRLCRQCRDARLVPLSSLIFEIRCLVHHSSKIVAPKRRWGPDIDYALKKEAAEIEEKYLELKDSPDPLPLVTWAIERKTVIGKRLREAIVIQEFLDNIESEREQELRELKNARRRDIENRLTELGWDKKDMKFTYHFPSRKDWYYLVEQPRPLTERVWSNIQPKLIPILEANREARLQKEKSERQSARRLRLTNLLIEIKKSQAPVLDINVRAPTDPQESSNPDESRDVSPGAGSSSSIPEAQPSNEAAETSSNVPQSTLASGSVGNVVQPPTRTTLPGIFPDIVDALEWPMLKALFENDTSVSVMEQNFVECRSEIDAAIADWKLTTHDRMVEMLRQGGEIEGELLTPRLIVQKEDSDPFTNLSDDLKLLLRADSLFTSTSQNNGSRRELTSYDMALTRFGYRLSFRDGVMGKPYKPPLELSRIRVCGEARQAAQVLLVHMGLENACIAELKGVGRGFACGRCHDSRMKTWEELVSHFVEAKEIFARVQGHADKAEAPKVTYRDVHDPEMFPGRPLVKYTPSQIENPIRTCTICSKDPINLDVRGPEVNIFDHLRDVHEITEPKLGTHFSNSNLPYPYGFDPSWHFDFDLDAGLFFTPFGDSESESMDPFWDGDFW
ncbi:hypothetical protein B0J17DRAFT_619431 [Rhizoctonia solani]|nr:hypothetical protein B0J17DRAFT_619431 [Rhizoctonia solani]